MHETLNSWSKFIYSDIENKVPWIFPYGDNDFIKKHTTVLDLLLQSPCFQMNYILHEIALWKH